MDPYANPDPYARRGFDDGGTTGDSTTTQPPLQTGYMQRVDPRLAFGGIDPSQLQRAEQYRQDAINDRKKQEAARQDAESKEQYNADQMSTILDQATAAIKKSREGRSNLALMTLGANMMGPGNFGDQLGRGLRAMVPAIQKQREEDTQEEITLANLGVKRWDMQNAPLKTKLDYLRAMEKGDIDTQRAIELAQLKTGSAEQIAREKLAAQPPKALGGGVFWDPHTKQLQRVGLLGVTDVNSANQRTGALAGTLQDVPSTPIEGAGVDRSRDDKTFGTGQGGYNEEFMKQLETQNPGVAAMVKALARGEKQFPGDRGKWSQDQSDLLALVKEYDPSFNTMDYNARSKTLQSFTSGDDAKAIAALKLAISHMGSLHHAAGALDGGDIQSINAVKNWFKTQFGSSDVTNFNAIAHPVAEEIARVFKGSNLSDTEIKEWQKTLNPNMSPQQIQDAMDKLQEMLKARLGTLEEKYNQGMGKPSAGHDILGNQARDKLKQMDDSPLPGSNKYKERQQTGTATGHTTGQYHEGQTAKLKDGTPIVFKGGNWVRQ